MLDKLPELQCHPSYAIDGSHIDIVRNWHQNANQKGQYITISSISDLIREKEPKARFHRERRQERLYASDLNLGFGKRSQHLFETDEIIERSQKYLRRIRANRDKQGLHRKPEIYLDESYVNKNLSP